MSKKYVVVRPFRDKPGMLLAGTYVKPEDLRSFKSRLGDKHIREVTEDNFEEIASYLLARHKVVLEGYTPPVVTEPPKEEPPKEAEQQEGAKEPEQEEQKEGLQQTESEENPTGEQPPEPPAPAAKAATVKGTAKKTVE